MKPILNSKVEYEFVVGSKYVTPLGSIIQVISNNGYTIVIKYLSSPISHVVEQIGYINIEPVPNFLKLYKGGEE